MYVRSPGPGITEVALKREVGPEGLSCQISGLLINGFWVDSSLTLRYGDGERQVVLLLAKMPLALWWGEEALTVTGLGEDAVLRLKCILAPDSQRV